MMIAIGIIIIVLLLLFFWTRREGFEVWPIPLPEQIGRPSPPSIMRRDQTTAQQLNEDGSSETQEQDVDFGDSPGDYSPADYGMYGQDGPDGYGMYGQYGPGGYGQYGMYNPYMQSRTGIMAGGNISGSASIGGFGPTARPSLLTPAQVASMQAATSSGVVTPAMSPSAMSAQMAASASAQQSASASAPTIESAPVVMPQTPRASTMARESRARTMADEANIAGFDWGTAAAQSAVAFEPTEVIETPSPEVWSEPINPFETVDADKLRARTTLGPNVTRTTAAALPTGESMALAEQKLIQASFGSALMGNPMIQGPIMQPAVSTVTAVRGSRNQPGGGLHDSKSNRTVIDSTMLVPQSLQPVVEGVSAPAGIDVASVGTSVGSSSSLSA